MQPIPRIRTPGAIHQISQAERTRPFHPGPSVFLARQASSSTSPLYFFKPIMKRHALIFGLVGGLLIATLQYTEYRFVVIEHSVELYGALIAILFSAFGIWLGLRITRKRKTIVREVLAPGSGRGSEPASPFAPNTAQQRSLGITGREL